MSRLTWERYYCSFKTSRHLERDLSCPLLIVVVHIVTFGHLAGAFVQRHNQAPCN